MHGLLERCVLNKEEQTSSKGKETCTALVLKGPAGAGGRGGTRTQQHRGRAWDEVGLNDQVLLFLDAAISRPPPGADGTSLVL